jgi:hypothetical protein
VKKDLSSIPPSHKVIMSFITLICQDLEDTLTARKHAPWSKMENSSLYIFLTKAHFWVRHSVRPWVNSEQHRNSLHENFNVMGGSSSLKRKVMVYKGSPHGDKCPKESKLVVLVAHAFNLSYLEG